jgi:hypothetical protein
MIRPELREQLWDAREGIVALGVVAFGAWLVFLGGWVLIPFGTAIAALGTAFGVLALRRMRFGQGVHAPGIVEVDEAQISYFGPDGGGFVSVRELVELRLAWVAGRRHWRLKQADGQTLLVPVAAVGADRLFDAFAVLPGMASQNLLTALDAPPGQTAGRGLAVVSGEGTGIGPVIWQRPSLLALTRP